MSKAKVITKTWKHAVIQFRNGMAIWKETAEKFDKQKSRNSNRWAAGENTKR